MLFIIFSRRVDFSMLGRGSTFLFSIRLPTLLVLENCVHACILLGNASFLRKELRNLCIFKARESVVCGLLSGTKLSDLAQLKLLGIMG